MPSQPMRTIIITGAARGIGRAIAEELLSQDCAVIGTYHQGASEAKELVRAYGPQRVDMRRVDLSKRVQTRQFIEHVQKRGSIDGLVLNAGVIEFAPLAATSE